MAFAASVKTSALNWPHHRGTATAFPLAAFGLSAFFFSIFGAFFPGDTSDFLMALAVGTFVLTLGGFFFLQVLPHHSYHAVPGGHHGKDSSDSQQLRPASRPESRGGRPGRGHIYDEPGTSNQTTPNPSEEADEVETPRPSQDTTVQADVEAGPAMEEEADIVETSSLMSNSSSSSLPGDVLVQSSVDLDRSHRIDIRGWQLLRNVEFWQFFSIMGILAGIGLMTIK